MNTTGPLSVLGDLSFDEKTININPNDGFDLGLMTTEHIVKIYVGSDAPVADDHSGGIIHGKIHLSNRVSEGCVEMSLKTISRLGGAKKVVLSFVPEQKCGRLGIRPD